MRASHSGRGRLTYHFFDQVLPGDQRLPATPDGTRVAAEPVREFIQRATARTQPEEIVLPAVGVLGTDEAIEQQRAIAAPARAVGAGHKLADDGARLDDDFTGTVALTRGRRDEIVVHVTRLLGTGCDGNDRLLAVTPRRSA